MAKFVRINIGGKEWPLGVTNGALLRFEQGREQYQGDFLQGLFWIWCCLTAAAVREGRRFEMSFEEFADATDPEDIAAWAQAVTVRPAQPDDSKKKGGR